MNPFRVLLGVAAAVAFTALFTFVLRPPIVGFTVGLAAAALVAGIRTSGQGAGIGLMCSLPVGIYFGVLTGQQSAAQLGAGLTLAIFGGIITATLIYALYGAAFCAIIGKMIRRREENRLPG